MATRWKQKASVALAIIAILCLFLLLIMLWSAVSNGMLQTTAPSSSSSSSSLLSTSLSLSGEQNNSNNNNNNNNSVRENEWRRSQQYQQHKQRNLQTNILDTAVNFRENDQQIHQDNKINEVINKDTEDIKIDEYITEEFIKPSKIHHLPLHTDDLLYESKKYNKSITDNYLEGYRITGNYRTKSSRIWDPHPEYTIEAFGHRMHLILYQDASFVPETFKVTSVYNNRTEVHLDDHKNDIACHYKGNVLGDQESVVAVSLCDGMTGHIKTSFGSFFIQPIGKYTPSDSATATNNDDVELIHRIWREPSAKQKTKESLKNIKNQNCPLEEHLKAQKNNNPYHQDLRTLASSSSSSSSSFFNDTNTNHHRRRKRNVYSDHQYTLEVLIAIDKKMSEFHGEHKIKHYVLTLMSIVSNIFSDASIGNSINVAVVNIMVLKEDLSLQYIEEGVYASHLLKKFCGFMQRRSEHYDTAILLTREQICRNTTETRCDTLGLAELGTVCKKHSCSIVQDNGLSAAFTIAHELGHILNMPHDDDEKCTKFEKYGRRMLNIMSSTMGDEMHLWSWSDCSRHYVTEFLEQDDVSCMEDAPTRPYNRTTKKLPGEIYSLDQQCELIHGQGSQYCLLKDQKECGRLWCIEKSNMRDCRSSNLPWADGTRCKDENHWCQKGECVHRDRKHLRPIDGGWGPWSSYTPCSRTCGGGIQESQRECNNPIPQNGGKYCVGNHKRYRSCHTNDCPFDSMDFREKQCFDLNGKNFGITGIDRYVKWIPKYGVSPKDECKLFCRIKGSNTYFQLGDKVVDGTTCSFDSFNKCVNGVCRSAGCDNELFSNAKLDRCGVCEGNNDTCIEISKVFYKSDLDRKTQSRSKIYYHVVTIPKGASNVVITQPGYPLTNYIVLLNDEGTYLINGDNVINTFRKELPYAGVTIDYSGANSTLERVNTTYARRLQKDLIVEILSLPKEHQTENEILITYSYTISKTHPHYTQYLTSYNSAQHDRSYHVGYSSYSGYNVREETYRWDVDQWSQCDSICSGKRFRNMVCILVEANQKVSDTYCQKIPKPYYELQSSCHVDCEIVAEVSSVSECSASCEKRGIRFKSYKCIQKYFYSNYSKIIDMSYCQAKYTLSTEEECIGSCANWTYTEWTPCSQTCSWNGQVGKQTRSVICVQNGITIDDSHCPPSRKYQFKDTKRTCNIDACPYEYAYGEETPKRTRPLKSVSSYHHTYNTYNEPISNHDIITNNIDLNLWETGEWNFCSRITCQRNRTVYCRDPSGYGCLEDKKPDSVQNCCDIKYVQKWSPCSVECGIGIRKKEFICAKVSKPLRSGEKRFKISIDPRVCGNLNLEYPKPKKREKICRKKHCIWEKGPWSSCTCNQYSTRNVICKNFKGQIVEQKNCDMHKKPAQTIKCKPCIRVEEKYTNCTCEGRKRRRVTCYDSNNKHIQCPNDPKYASSSKIPCTPPEGCLPRSCLEVRRMQKTLDDGEYIISIKKRPINIYCYNMSGKPKEFINVNATENMSVYYDKRLMDVNSCPTNPRNQEYHDSMLPSGSTRFEKISIELNTLRVILDDYTFAITTGKPQPYGSAGDCYNRNKQCPQGYFSINLKNTGFKIRPKVKWDTYGEFSTIDYVQWMDYPNNNVVKAYCGGYCGGCSVSRHTNLILDVV